MTQGGNALMQSTKPDSVGMGLNDSPAGLAAWMLNLINTGAEDHDVEQAFGGQERLLTNFSLYWLTGTGPSSARWYWTEAQIMQAQKEIPEWANVPTAFLLLPREAPTTPDWVKRKADLVRFTNLPRGGHFIALEVPELFAADLKAFRQLLVDREE